MGDDVSENRIDSITITERKYQRDQPSTFVVSFRALADDPEWNQGWYREFGIRDSLGNPTKIGMKMGVKTRDRRISMFSDKGRAIEDYLHQIAWKFARSLVNYGAYVLDNSSFGSAKRARESLLANRAFEA